MHYLLGLLLSLGVNVWAQELSVPALTSPVMDLAGILNEQEKADLSSLAYEIHTNQGPQITILTVQSLEGYAIEDYSMKVAEQWKLGTKDKGNGLLVLISKDDHKMRIEVGEGIEGEITDYDTSVYTRKVFPEYFRRGEFHAGLRLFMQEVAKKFNIKAAEESPRYVRPRARSGKEGAMGFLLIVVVVVAFIIQFLFSKKPVLRALITGVGSAAVGFFAMPSMMIFLFIGGCLLGLVGVSNLLYALSAGGRGSYRGGGSFGGGGGSWGGGGGGFSGGGSSGSW